MKTRENNRKDSHVKIVEKMHHWKSYEADSAIMNKLQLTFIPGAREFQN
jgi:hypothetical protein